MEQKKIGWTDLGKVLQAIEVLKKMGGTPVGSRALGLATEGSDFDVVFTDTNAFETAKKYLLELSTVPVETEEFTRYQKRTEEKKGRYGMTTETITVPVTVKKALFPRVAIDLILADRVWSVAEQIEARSK